ncbi:MAG: thioredoxin domain-containing protein, partial [Acidocella sp. 20-61-6]
IPHFEKMLYDNALLLDLLALAYTQTGTKLFAERARETVTWLQRDMASEAAFAASEDADSEGVEGKFYVWSLAEIQSLLGPDTDFFAQHYPLPAQGNWEHSIILERVTPQGDAATETRLKACRERLLTRRATRIRPGRDDKILTDWNALTVAALVRASFAFNEPSWLAAAQTLFERLLAALGAADGRIAHAMRDGKISAAGLLEDHATMLRAALALYEATGVIALLDQALRLLAATEAHFSDHAGSFTMASADATDLPGPRLRNITDGPTPSGIGLMAENYARLLHLTGDPTYRAKAEALLAAHGGQPNRLAAAPVLLAAADLLENATCIVLTGGNPALTAAALAAPDPAIVILRIAPGQILHESHPAYGKSSAASAAFLCRGGICTPPVTTPQTLRAQLRQLPQNRNTP